MIERLNLRVINSSAKHVVGSETEYKIDKRVFIPFTGSTIFFGTAETGIPVAIKFSAVQGGSRKEWIGLTKAYSAGVPTPKPLCLAEDITGFQALVSERVDGVPLYLSPQEELKQQLGRIVREMHNRVLVDGREWAKSGKGDFTYYDRYILYWLKESTGGLGRGSRTLVLLQKLTDAMRNYCNTISPVFNHNDIHNGQVLVRKNRTLAIIDFENWKEESPLNEIATYLFHSTRTNASIQGFKNFIDGYSGNSPLTERDKETLMFYLLFVSARAVGYFQSTGSDYLEKARENHQMILNFLDGEHIWKLT